MTAYRRVDDLRSPAGDCLYTGPNARYRVWETFTFYLLLSTLEDEWRLHCATRVTVWTVCCGSQWSVIVDQQPGWSFAVPKLACSCLKVSLNLWSRRTSRQLHANFGATIGQLIAAS